MSQSNLLVHSADLHGGVTLRRISLNKISRLDLELARSNGAIVGNFRIGIQDANTNALRIRMGIALIGLLVTLPAALGLAAGFLKQFHLPWRAVPGFGIASFYDSMTSWNHTMMWSSLFIGAPLALVSGVVAITRIGFTRAQDKIKTFLAVQVNPLVLFAIAVPLAVVVLFWGHLVADTWACMRGITSAC